MPVTCGVVGKSMPWWYDTAQREAAWFILDTWLCMCVQTQQQHTQHYSHAGDTSVHPEHLKATFSRRHNCQSQNIPSVRFLHRIVKGLVIFMLIKFKTRWWTLSLLKHSAVVVIAVMGCSEFNCTMVTKQPCLIVRTSNLISTHLFMTDLFRARSCVSV